MTNPQVPPTTPLQAPNRREFLKKGFTGAGLLALGAVLPQGCASYAPYLRDGDESQLKFLSVKDFAILLAAADALLPAEKPYPSHRDVGTAMKLDTEFAQWETVRSNEVPTLLRLIEHGTFLFGYSTTRFTNLTLERQRDYLSQWGDSSIAVRRTGFISLKGLLAFYYYSAPQVWGAIGYDGPWLGRLEIPILPVDGLPA